MTQTFDLNKMGLAEMGDLEIQQIEGGSIPSWLKGFGIAWAVGQVIGNWENIKKGAANGWNSVSYN
ncbi:MAG: hypothetical protein ABIQ31_15470 [Ferruginibacter sp.]